MVIAGSARRGGPVAPDRARADPGLPDAGARGPSTPSSTSPGPRRLCGLRLGAFAPDLEGTLDQVVGPRREP